MPPIRLIIDNQECTWAWRIEMLPPDCKTWETAQDGSGFVNFIDANRAAQRALSAYLAEGRAT